MRVGLDLGSRFVKLVVMEQGRLERVWKYDTLDFYRRYGQRSEGKLFIDFDRFDLDITEGTVVATGYGRQAARVSNAKIISEIAAHVGGAGYLTGLTDFTLLDLGGQDSKVALARGGRLRDFLTNDKCAASTGRYLENMAAVLGISLEELSRHHRSPVELTSTCAVFGESELIDKIAEGREMEALAAGVNYSVFKRIYPMLTKLRSEQIVFTGGVAHSRALVEIIRQETGAQVLVPEHPEFAGAVGCCLD